MTRVGTGTVAATASAGRYSFATVAGAQYTLAPTGGLPTTPATSLTVRAITASSSVEAGGRSAASAADGDTASSAGSMGWSSSNTTGSNHTESVTADLGSDQLISRVDLSPRSDAPNTGYGYPVDFTIDVSTDGVTWTNAVTKTGVAQPGNSVQSYSFTPTDAQYIRVTGTTLRSNPNDGNKYRMQFAEIQPYGSLAAGKAVSTSSTLEGSGWGQGDAVNTSPTSTSGDLGWTSTSNTGTSHTEWLSIDLGTSAQLSSVVLAPRTDSPNAGYGFPVDFTIAVSPDNTTWTNVVTKTGYALPTTPQTFSFAATSARYVKVTGTSLRSNPNDNNLYRMQLAEVGAF